MGISASSLLDDATAGRVTDRAEAELQDFSPYYRGQYSAARFAQVEEDLEPRKEKITQLLKQKEVAEDGEVLYEDGLLYFDESRKWRERYVVVRANYCLECHDGLETFLKGVPPRHKLLPTGGAVFTTEEKYMAAVDKCFPDDSSVKEDFAPALAGLPGQFPVYLRLPYRRDSYFCFRQQSKQDRFLSILSDCIRHQNHDFLKKESLEVQSFLRAVQLCRQDRGNFLSWELLVGSDVRVMGNLVMEQLLPSLETELLPRLKAKKTEKKRVWFATVEAAYLLAQQRLLEGLSALKEECRSCDRQQEVLMLSDMDQIVATRRQLEEAVRAEVQQPLEQLCEEAVQPHLEELLEELLQPISCGFLEGRRQAEQQMEQVCQEVLRGDAEQAQQALLSMSRPNLLSCYQKVAALQDKLPLLQQRFGFSNMTAVIDRAELELQQLMENAAFTFQQLLFKAVDEHPDEQQAAVDKVKHRVLKHYDYDSSTVRKRISREALVSITLPFIKKNLEKSCKTALQGLQQSVNEDHAHFVHIHNVYEDVLLQSLDSEVGKVVREAAALRKYDLSSDSRDLLSQSSRSSLSSPPSSPASPAKSPTPAKPAPPNGLPEGEEVNQGAPLTEVVMVHETQQEVEAALKVQQEVAAAPQIQKEVESALKVQQEVAAAPQTQQEVKPALKLQQEVEAAPQTQQEVEAVPQTQEEVEAAPQTQQEVNAVAPETQQEVEEAPMNQQEMEAAAPLVQQEVEAATPQKKQEKEVAAPQVQQEVEAKAPQTQEEVEAAPKKQQEVEAVASQVQQEVEAAAPQVQQEVEAAAPQAQQEVEAAAPQAQQEVEVIASQVQQEVEAAAPQVQQEVEAIASQAQQEVEAAAPQVQQEVEAAAPQVQQEVEAIASQVQQEVEAAAPQAQQEVEAEAPQTQEEVEAEAPQTQQEVEAAATQVQQEVEAAATQVQQEVEAAPKKQQEVEAAATQTQQEVEAAAPQTQQEVEAAATQAQQEVEAAPRPQEDDAVAPPGVQDSHLDQVLLQPPPEFQTRQEVEDMLSGSAPSGDLGQSEVTSGDREEEKTTEARPTEPNQREAPSVTEAPPPSLPPPGSVQEIRDLVVEVIEVEELLQRYPSGIPADQ
ncbi:protein Niban 1-like isoform X3 [Nelusetta ayraudi]|uniref:protein Niban 1-like isoform X3 n=1 Tax=Nelusetta ayraudi TaxID=303726 RepID=UPI003F6F1A23